MNYMERFTMSRPTFTILIPLMVLCVFLSTGSLKAKKYDIVKDGKLTEHARFVGVFHPQRDQKDDGTFTFGNLYNFLHAGAGFTTADARICIKLSMSDPRVKTGAIIWLNNQGVNLGQSDDNRFYVSTQSHERSSEKKPDIRHAGEAIDPLEPGTPFEVELILKDGSLTYNIDGKEVAYVPRFFPMKEAQPKETAEGHGLELSVALRPWREREMKVHEFFVETEGDIVAMPEVRGIFKGVRSFRGGELKPGTTHLYRIPALTVSKKGTVLAFAEARRDSAADHGNIDTVIRRSEDNGKTWGPEIVIADDGENTMGNPCPVVDQDTGRVWLHLCWNAHEPPKGGYKPGFGDDSRRAFVTYSDDDGKTWAEPKEITKQAKKENWSWYATGPGGGIQLTRGEHKGRLIIPCCNVVHPPSGGTTWHSYIIYSDNHGETWQIGAISDHGRNESIAVELEDGSVMLNSRIHGISERHRGVSISNDGGETFAKSYYDPMLLEPYCQGSISRVRWADGDKPGVLVFSNPAWMWRTHMMVRYSYDDGKTWPTGRMIYPWTSAYSDTTVLPDGRVAVLFEKDWWGSVSLAILPAPPATPPSPKDEEKKE